MPRQRLDNASTTPRQRLDNASTTPRQRRGDASTTPRQRLINASTTPRQRLGNASTTPRQRLDNASTAPRFAVPTACQTRETDGDRLWSTLRGFHRSHSESSIIGHAWPATLESPIWDGGMRGAFNLPRGAAATLGPPGRDCRGDLTGISGDPI